MKSKSTDLIIFDLDGTLLDTIDDLAVSTNHALRQYGYPEHELKQYCFFVGNGITKLIERALPEEARKESTILELRKVFVEYYQQHKTDLTHPYLGIPELLHDFKSAGIRLAVASNKYNQGTQELIRHYFGRDLFSVVLGQRDNIPVKPDPAIVNDILQQTGIAKANTLYVGDSGVDMQTANNSGLTSIGVTWGFRPRQELESNGAHYIADKPEQIKEAISWEAKRLKAIGKKKARKVRGRGR